MAQRTADPLEESLVVDVDVHLSYLRSRDTRIQVAGYMDEPWASMVHPDGAKASPYPTPGWDKSLGGRKNIHVEDVSSVEQIEANLCEGLGVDHPIINTLARVDSVTQTERAVAEARAANRLLVERFLDGHDDYFGLISVPARDPHRAAEEIDHWAGEDGVVGVFFETGTEYQKPLGHPDYDVMYRAMEDADLTPLYHLAISHNDHRPLRQLENYASVHSLGPLWSGSLGVASLVFGGVPEKFPDLSFVFVEYGISWIPFMYARLNREHGQWTEELPLLRKSPEEYIRDSFYFGTQPIGEFEDAEHMRRIIEVVGAESLVFASDYPHHDFDNPTVFDEFLSAFPPEEREQILSGNAVEAFDLPV